MRKIGIFGGSFNPIHYGHLVLAERACEALELDRVILVPAKLPPHKDPAALAEPSDRLRMVRLAVADNARLDVSDIELRRGGRSYSVDTVEMMRRRFGGKAELFFLIGADTVAELRTWRDIRRLVKLCTFVPLSRPGIKVPRATTLARALGKKEAQAILRRMIPMPLLDISASDIRRRVGEGRSIRYLVPAAVAEHISRKRLYQFSSVRAEPSQPQRCSEEASRRSSGRRRRAQG